MKCRWCAPAGFVASLAVHAALVTPFLIENNLEDAPVPPETRLVLEVRMFQIEPSEAATPELPPAPQQQEQPEPEPEPVPEPDPEPVQKVQKKPEPAAKPKPVEKPKQKSEPRRVTQQAEAAKKATKPRRKKAPSQARAVSAATKQEVASAEASYRSKVRALIERNKFYPMRAKRNRSSGEVRVSFRLQRDGGMTNLRISRSSGAPVLDRAALKAVQKVGKFPPFPKASSLTSWEFTVPLLYRLPR